MDKLPGYHILKKISDNGMWALYKAYSVHEDKAVLIKKVTDKDAGTKQIAELIHAYHITKNLASSGILRPVKLVKHGDQPYIVTEAFSGVTLDQQLEKGPFELHAFFKLAIQVASIISTIHQEHIMHKSIQPKNILINPQTDELKLIGFHQATKLSIENQHPNVRPFTLKDHAAYISPEQTGRMNRSIDYRTDLYSLGATFYEMLTGRIPFQLNDPAELIHAHIAKIPKPPTELNPGIPEIVSSIIMKLLEKSPEYRYQSAHGLKEDLEKCVHYIRNTGNVRAFKLGMNDIAPTFQERPNKLYGREKEIKQIHDVFHRVLGGHAEFLLISGSSGIGKTALVNELYKPLGYEKGYFISGKFVMLQKHMPYAPIIQAFQGLIRQLLSEGSENIKKWKGRLLTELSPYASVIANFIPEIKWLIGSQPDVSDLPPQAMHNRFRHAIRKFIHVFAKENHPLIFFLDDLQWADHATIDMIEHLLSNPESSYLLLVGAYRDNEVDVGHPFEIMLKNRKENAVKFTEIPIRPLEYKHIQDWICEKLVMNKKQAAFLNELMYRITQGNPFFMVQLFQSLYEENILSLDESTSVWNVNSKSLKEIPMDDTIIDFILRRIGKLPQETIRILQIASCFGNRFDLKSLATIAGKNFTQIAEMLWKGLEEGLILPLDPGYKWVHPEVDALFLDEEPPSYLFLHDKVQQAFYMMMPDDVREENHLKIGQELLKHKTRNELEENIFEIVNHLNPCQSKLSSGEKLDLAEWNWIAGTKAKQNAAMEAALTFFTIGQELLPQKSWNRHYDITFRIMMGLGEAQYLNHRFKGAETTFDETLKNAKTKQEKLSVYNLKISLYTHIHQVEKATDTGLAGLQLFGGKIGKNPGKLAVAKEYIMTKLALGRKQAKDLLELPSVTDPDQRLVMRTLINTNAPTYHVNQNLATILMLRALKLTLKYGDMDVSALVYNNYALTLSAGFNDYEGSYKFGKLAIQHTEKYQDDSLKARVYFVFGSFVNHWKNHIRYNVEYLERSQRLCIESGNLHLAGANGAFIGMTLFIKGDNLQQVASGIERQLTFARENEYALSNDFLSEVMDWIELLSSRNLDPDWNFPEFTDDASAAIIHYTLRLQMTYLFHHEREAEEILKKLEPLVDNTLVLVIAPDYYFYHALWLARQMRVQSIPLKQGMKKIKRKVAKLNKWANHSPDNYRHKYLLVKAELAGISGDDSDAIPYYNQAITLAEESGFLQDAAIASECAAYYYLSEQLPKTAKAFMSDAYAGYSKWGAMRIAHRLHQMYADLIMINEHKDSLNQLDYNGLDIHAIFQGARAISDEVVLEKLLKKLMHIVLTNAGAEHVHLMLNNDGDWKLVATNHAEGDAEIYAIPENIAEHSNFSLKIVDYVVNSCEPVVLEDAAVKGAFTREPYIKKRNIKSVLCFPILYQNKLTGILYLENNQSAYAFTRERIDLLTLLASQAAVSIENAYLYSHLEDKVEKRTKLLHEANKKLTKANHSLAKSEEARRHLLSNISHDLRSPIAAAQGHIDAILDGLVETPEQEKNYLQVIKRRLHSLNGLIQDLFELARLESGNIALAMDIVPIDQLFSHLCSQYELEINKAGLDYQWVLPPYPDNQYPLVEVDIRRMEQVMTNLISNAIKHTDAGFIHIGISLENNNQVLMYVEDQGTGIPQSELSHIFERSFTRSRNRANKGNGLGLAISKEIITLHKGKIWAESEEGAGTKFYFSLPIFEVAEVAAH